MLNRSAIQNQGFRSPSKVRRKHDESVPENKAEVSYLRNLRVNVKDFKQSEEKNNSVMKLLNVQGSFGNIKRYVSQIKPMVKRNWRLMLMLGMVSSISLLSLQCPESVSARRCLAAKSSEQGTSEPGSPKKKHPAPNKAEGKIPEEKSETSSGTGRKSETSSSNGSGGSGGGAASLGGRRSTNSGLVPSTEPAPSSQEDSSAGDHSVHDPTASPKEPAPQEETDASAKFCAMKQKKAVKVAAAGTLVGAGLVACLTHLADIKHVMDAQDILDEEARKIAKKDAEPITGLEDPRFFEQINDIAEWVEPEMNLDGTTVESFFTTTDWARTDAFIGIVSMISVVITFVLWVMSCSQWSQNRSQLKEVFGVVQNIQDDIKNDKMTLRSDFLEGLRYTDRTLNVGDLNVNNMDFSLTSQAPRAANTATDGGILALQQK